MRGGLAMFCPECGKEIEAQSIFCSNWGVKVESGTSSTSFGNACKWCTKELPESAINCPSCGKLRKDIYKDKLLCYLFLGFSILPTFLFGLGIGERTWHVGGLIGGNFSIGKLFTSVSGVFLIISFAVCLIYAAYYYVKVSKKLGTWIWG